MWFWRQRNPAAGPACFHSDLDDHLLMLVRLSAPPLMNSAVGSIITIGLWAAILIRHVKIRALDAIQDTRHKFGPRLTLSLCKNTQELYVLYRILKAHPVGVPPSRHVSVSQSFLWCALLLPFFPRLDKLSSFPSHLSPLPFSRRWSFTSLEFSHFLSRSRSIYDCGSRGRRGGQTFFTPLFIIERTTVPAATVIFLLIPSYTFT